MNTKRIEIMEELVKHIKQIRKFEDSVGEMFGCYPDGGSYQAVEELLHGYTELVAKTLGVTLDGLEWFIYENDCGADGRVAGVEGNMRKVWTIEDFLWAEGLPEPEDEAKL